MDIELRRAIADRLLIWGVTNPALRLVQCGEGGRGWIAVCANGHQKYCAYRCEQRICPTCAAVRSRELSAKLAPAIYEQVIKSDGEYSLKHLVLGTNINALDYLDLSVSPQKQVKLLNELAYKVKFWRGFVADLLRSYKKQGLVLGFAIGAEFGMKAGTLHFHILMLAKYIPQRKISEDWAKFNLGWGSYVWIRDCGREHEMIAKEVSYIAKYVTKPLALVKREGGLPDTKNVNRMSSFIEQYGAAPLLAAVSYVFIGMRRFQTYGVFFDLDFEDSLPAACEVCGLPLEWHSELGVMVSPNWAVYSDYLLNTLAPNNLGGGGVRYEQLVLF